jgi:hypothetical protein
MLPEGALTDDVVDTINTTHDLRLFPLSYHSIKRLVFNLDVIPCRATRVRNSSQQKLQAEREEFSKLTVDEKEFVRIRKNRDKALFGAVEDQCNDSVGLLMQALAYLDHDTSNGLSRATLQKGKKNPPNNGSGMWNEEYYMFNIRACSKKKFKMRYQILTRVVMQESARVHTGTKIPMVTH